MRQNEFVLKIISVKDLTDEEQERLNYKGERIIIEVWDVQCNFIIDEKITEFYPQLIKIGLSEFSEGELSYSNSGFLRAQELKELLERWGFILYGSDKHLSLKFGGEVECKIKPKYDLEVQDLRDEVKELEESMNKAIEEEDYERAAKIRDEIKSKNYEA
jgi:hypothetical protein